MYVYILFSDGKNLVTKSNLPQGRLLMLFFKIFCMRHMKLESKQKLHICSPLLLQFCATF